jgi:hypothetical protein
MFEEPRKQRWSVEVYYVLDGDRQQRILEAFRDSSAREEITALGTQSGRDWLVVVETGSVEDRFFARNTIKAIDVHATRSYSFKPSQLVGPMLPAS